MTTSRKKKRKRKIYTCILFILKNLKVNQLRFKIEAELQKAYMKFNQISPAPASILQFQALDGKIIS